MTSDKSVLAAVHQLFADRHSTTNSPELVYAVRTAEGLVSSAGFGRYDDGTAIPSADRAFRIASCTKSFTAAVVLQLRDRGLLHLDDEIATYLPEIGLTHTSPPVTVRMLLTMSGGLPTDDAWADRQESISSSKFRGLLASGLRFAYVPDTTFEYSNMGYALLGQAVEAVTGAPYLEVVTSELLEPLGLSATGFASAVDAPGGVATGYRHTDGRWVSLPFSSPGAFSPIGGIFSTAEDLVRWAGWLADGFAGDDDGESDETATLSRASRRQMQQAHRAIPPGTASPTASSLSAGPVITQGYGYGLVVQSHPLYGRIVSHSGGYPGFGSHMRWHPASGLTIVGFENVTYSNVQTTVAEALDLLLAAHPADTTSSVTRLWPETVAARDDVETLIRRWDNALAEHILADNARLDEPLQRRREHLAAALAKVGPLHESGQALGDVLLCSSSPAHLVWSVPAARGHLECEIRLHPLNPPKVQTLTFTARRSVVE